MFSPMNCGSPLNAGSQMIELHPLNRQFNNSLPSVDSANVLKVEPNKNSNTNVTLNIESFQESFKLEQTEIDKIDEMKRYFNNLRECLEQIDVREYFAQNTDANISTETMLSKINDIEVSPYKNIAFKLLPQKIRHCNKEKQYLRKSTSKVLSYTQQLVLFFKSLVNQKEVKERKRVKNPKSSKKNVIPFPKIFQADFAERSTFRRKITTLQICTVVFLLIILNGIQLSLLIMQEIQKSKNIQSQESQGLNRNTGYISLTRIYMTIFELFNIASTIILISAMLLIYTNKKNNSLIAVISRFVVIIQMMLMIVYYSVNLDFTNLKLTIQIGKTVFFGILIVLFLLEGIFSFVQRFRPDLLERDFKDSKVPKIKAQKKDWVQL